MRQQLYAAAGGIFSIKSVDFLLKNSIKEYPIDLSLEQGILGKQSRFQSNSSRHQISRLKKYKKVLKSYDFRTFLVEISGIEPLTS